jgi:hypothetical protein
MSLAKPLDLNLADSLTHPFGSARLRDSQEDFGGGLRQHCLCILTVTGLHLAPALESKNDRILRFPILGDGCVKLRQPLQAGQLVYNKPHRLPIEHWFIEKAQNQCIDPQTNERAQRFAHRRS